uniref:Uncharacterized protein n=1 Tax=mine drainage metagenome TaxID=410659 RepID=E6QBA2_9ZZZZ
MFCAKAKKQIAAIQEVVRHNGRGIHKRIDENRELMELLQTKAPALLREYPWVEGWIHSQDDFLVEIEKVAGIHLHQTPRLYPFPRPWPGTAPYIPQPQDDTSPISDDSGKVAYTLAEIKDKRKQLHTINWACLQVGGLVASPRLYRAFARGFIGGGLVLISLLWLKHLPGYPNLPLAYLPLLGGISIFISIFCWIYFRSTYPSRWLDLIDMKLAEYDPVDKEAYRDLQLDTRKDGHFKDWRVHQWVMQERHALQIARGDFSPTRNDFLRKRI